MSDRGRKSGVHVLVLALLGSTLGALAKCPTPDPLDPHPCASCVAANGQEGKDMCAWCHSAKKCLPMQGLGQPCPDNADFSLFGGDCDCRPSENTDCTSCTKQLGCVWINEGQKNWTLSIAGVTLPPFATDVGHTCVSGSPAGPLLPAQGYQAVANLITVTMEPDVRQWCWGQCSIPGVGFAVAAVVGLAVGLSLLLCVARRVCGVLARGNRLRGTPAPVRVTVEYDGTDGRGGYYPLEGDVAAAARDPRAARTNGGVAMQG